MFLTQAQLQARQRWFDRQPQWQQAHIAMYAQEGAHIWNRMWSLHTENEYVYCALIGKLYDYEHTPLIRGQKPWVVDTYHPCVHKRKGAYIEGRMASGIGKHLQDLTVDGSVFMTT